MTSSPNLCGSCDPAGRPGAWRETSQVATEGWAHTLCLSQVLLAGRGTMAGERVRWRGPCSCGHPNDKRTNGCSGSHRGSSPWMALQPQPGHLSGAGHTVPSTNTSRKRTLETTPKACGLGRGVRNPRRGEPSQWGDHCDVDLRGSGHLHLHRALGPVLALEFSQTWDQ